MLLPGAVLQNRYTIIHLLGQGGMGAVYLAQDTRLARNVAVKENIGGDRKQFEREAILLANLDHPNLPRVQDHFVEPNGAQYLVMDYVQGIDLASHIQSRGPRAYPDPGWVDAEYGMELFDQILDAVAYLHSRGVIHRDIKPANIKITPQRKAVLVDFGIAKVFRADQHTMSGARAATPGYAAPEQYHGGTDARTDIYSLSATLYAFLTGRTPPDALVLESGSAVLVPPRSLNPSISPQIEAVILRGMSVKPQQRFQSAGEMRTALTSTPPEKGWITPPQAPPKAPVPLRRLQPKSFPLIPALAIGIVILLLFFAGLVWQMTKPLATRRKKRSRRLKRKLRRLRQPSCPFLRQRLPRQRSQRLCHRLQRGLRFRTHRRVRPRRCDRVRPCQQASSFFTTSSMELTVSSQLTRIREV